ncbi:MAG: carboxypeptidase-like regulatory domain-containing protein [Acidobacteriota bacterium]
MDTLIQKLIETVSVIPTQYRLAALGMVAIALLLARRRGKVPRIWWGAFAAITVLAIVPPLLVKDPIYRVRVTVLDLNQVPVDDARVWSSIGGEAKKVAGGWQFDVPAATKPANGRLTLYASVPSAFLAGRRDLQLEDRNPSIVIQLAKDTTAKIRGIVVDQSGKAIVGARVSVIGYESEVVLTAEGGNFSLAAHAADGQQVQLHAEKAGHRPANEWRPAGDHPITIVLQRK